MMHSINPDLAIEDQPSEEHPMSIASARYYSRQLLGYEDREMARVLCARSHSSPLTRVRHPIYRKVGGLHFVRLGCVGMSFFVSHNPRSTVTRSTTASQGRERSGFKMALIGALIFAGVALLAFQTAAHARGYGRSGGVSRGHVSSHYDRFTGK